MKIKDHFLTNETFELTETDFPGILRTSPIPVNLDKYYETENYISHHQDQGGFKEKLYKTAQRFNLNYKRNIVANVIQHGGKVLDYGCGAGEFLKYIESEFTTYGYEPNDSARSAAERKTSKTTLLNDIQQLQNKSLDAITLWHVFEHIDNQYDTLRHFHSLLKKGGKLIIAVPNYTSYDAQYYQENWAAYDVPRHIYHFSRVGMSKFFNNEHWKLQEIKPLLLDSFYISIISEKYIGNPLFWLKGSIVGAISNFKASKTGEFSSLIYIIEKK